ncbi:hypothetical protein BDY24DRAFT_374390 [Mrakia frigida]|uniref:putative peptide hydrolase n=1 Tax=Mrakia frigida TaxID=29902 RepID=UPI003FCC1883
MCGRVAQATHANEFVPRLQREVPTLGISRFASNENEQQGYRPRYNVGPKSNLPVIRRQGGENVLQIMNWSIIPHWTKHEPSFGESLRTVNARSETLTGAEEPSSLWKSLCATKRCIVPVQGYYEWIDRGGKSGKIPHYIRNPMPSSESSSAQTQDKAHDVDAQAPPAGPVASSSASSSATSASTKEPPFLYFAGLWDSVTYEELDSTPLYTFTILTTQSSPRVNFIHTRMPVILRTEEDMLLWLDCDPGAKEKDKRGTWNSELSALCKPFGRKGCDEDLVCYVVPQEVGKVQNQDESFIHPVSERKDGIERFFKKAAPKTNVEPAHPVASSSKRKVDEFDKDEGEDDEVFVKGKEEVEIVLSDEDDEVFFVGETKKKDTSKSTSSSSSQPSTKKAKTSSSSTSSSSQPKKPVKKKEKGKITSFFKPE